MKKLPILISAAVVFTAAILGGCSIGIMGETGGKAPEVTVNEYFKGKLSEESYATSEAAAQAFLADELSGSTTKAEFVSYNKSGDITEAELKNYDLGDLDLSKVEKAEKGYVTYRLTAVGSAAASLASSSATRSQGVAMLLVEAKYRYFVPATGTGEMVTKSYFESMWDPQNYLNVTSDMKMVIAMNASSANESHSMKMEMEIKLKATETAIEYTMSGDASLTGGRNIQAYIIEKDSALYMLMQTNGTWVHQKVIEGKTLAEYLLENSGEPEFFDYTYFEMTTDGYRLAPEKYQLYIENYSKSNPAFAEFSNDGASGEATYIVKDGKISKATTTLTLKASEAGMGATITASAVCDYTDYGTTTVTLPADLQAYIEENL